MPFSLRTSGRRANAGNTFLQPRRRTGIWLAAALGLVLVTAGVLAGMTLATRTPTTPAAASLANPAGTPSGDETSIPQQRPTAPGVTAVRGDLKLVTGRELVNGVAVRYPRTPAGAVSAGAEFLAQMGTFDPDRKAAVGRVIAEKAWANAADEFAQGAQSSRKHYGLPPTGPLPSGSSLAVSPQQYQIQPSTVPGEVTVLFLSYLVVTTQEAGTTSSVIVQPAALHWENGDWKLARDEDNDQAANNELLATPFSQKAISLGWRDLQP
ncbi:hypothetical protein [Kineosporia babensis]|uniref:Uncharacterized protein n=1 Tax=Kineosporia babensis TaxID=499548 RepID=A0A9X1SXF5_9ACTN|nr:hypothetical protein [Kineosporia babensis]MCD5316167.1 hypothetical protein [Kineosporia babensis]